MTELTYTDEDGVIYQVNFERDLAGNVEFTETENGRTQDFLVPGELVKLLVEHIVRSDP